MPLADLEDMYETTCVYMYIHVFCFDIRMCVHVKHVLSNCVCIILSIFRYHSTLHSILQIWSQHQPSYPG